MWGGIEVGNGVQSAAAFLSLAYVGPGAAISLLGALLAVLGAIFLTVFGALLWPIRALWRKITGGGSEDEERENPEGAAETSGATGTEEEDV